MIATLAWLILAVIAAGLALLTAYLVVLTVAALFADKSGPISAPGRRRFAILVPAHNEEALIGRLLVSIAELEYPSEQYDVCVVADNCTDATASLARAAGARVYERRDDKEKAQGFALRWLLQQLIDERRA